MSGNKVIICSGATYNEYVAQQNIFGTVNVNSFGNREKDSQTVSPVNLIGKKRLSSVLKTVLPVLQAVWSAFLKLRLTRSFILH